MDTSILLAQLIGPLFVVVGLGALVNQTHYFTIVVPQFLNDTALYYLSGALAFTAGLAIILHHNLWVADWPVVITAMGWISLVKGAIRIVFPRFGPKFTQTIVAAGREVRIATAGLTMAFGAWLSYLGFAG